MPSSTDPDRIEVRLGDGWWTDPIAEATIEANQYCAGRSKAAHLMSQYRDGIRQVYVYRCK